MESSAQSGVNSKPGEATEIEHWNEIERRARTGERMFWLNHPRVAYHYRRKGLIGGKTWQEWLVEQWGGPGKLALELGCGNGVALAEIIGKGLAEEGVGLDLDDSRFALENGNNPRVKFLAGDVNQIRLEPNKYDAVFALQAFHHFESLDYIMQQVSQSLTDRGYFVLDEYVGPRRFQWTDLQLALVRQLLAVMPRNLRLYPHGMEKRIEGRSTPEEVIKVCPSEAICSDEIVAAFYRNFEVVHHKKLGGTLQHLLYSGIIHNFPDDDHGIDAVIDGLDEIESTMIATDVLPSDFVLLVGRRRGSGRKPMTAIKEKSPSPVTPPAGPAGAPAVQNGHAKTQRTIESGTVLVMDEEGAEPEARTVRAHTGIPTDEKQKWDDYYSGDVPVDPPEVVELGNEVAAWLDSILPEDERKVLEAGSGAGAQSLALARTGRFDVHLQDISEEALRTARHLFDENGFSAHFELGDLFNGGYPDFDLVFNAGVIEHYEFDQQVRMVQAMAARSRGYVAVLAPNARCYWYWASRLRNSAFGNWPFGKEMPVTHLRDVFEAAGVELVSERYFGRAWTSLFIRNLPEMTEDFKHVLLANHASALMSDEETCYLYGAVGMVKAAAVSAAIRKPERVAPEKLKSERFTEDALRSLAADSLAVRVAAEVEINHLKARLAENERTAKAEADALRAEIAAARDEAHVERTEKEAEQQQTAWLRSEIAVLQNQLSARRNDLAAARVEADSALRRMDATRVELEGVHHRLEEALAEVAASRHEIAQLKSTAEWDASEKAHFQEMIAGKDHEIRGLAAKLDQALARFADLTNRNKIAEDALERSRNLTRAFVAGIEQYESKLEASLADYSSQRAWRMMVAVRKAYDLWARHGIAGKVQALPLALTSPLSRSQYPEQEVYLPSVRHSFQHIGILSLEFHVDKLSRPLL